MLRIDNGGELCKKEFEEFCKKCGMHDIILLHTHLRKMELQKE